MNLTVEDHGECGGWPCEVTWKDPDDGEDYLYRFETVSNSHGRNLPVYAYVPADY